MSVRRTRQPKGDTGATGPAGSGGTYLGHVISTADFGTSSGTPVQATSFTVTVTVPASAKVKLTFSANYINNGNVNAYAAVTLWDGTVGSGTQVGSIVGGGGGAAGDTHPASLVVYLTPSTGSHTYNVALDNQGVGGTATIHASATAPALLLVEVIG